ncbi:MAG: ThiF family adenylyltransferase [Bryobacteraceae bacterium]|nr:ThiF family adenylyltransferase [Bryobacteraceae bacterium]
MIKQRRQEARRRAADYLDASGFTSEAGLWLGVIGIDSGGSIPIRLSLPDGFPDVLPVIEVDVQRLPRRVPHVESNGKLCLAPSTGVLLDADNPEGIIRDALEIASRTLTDGVAGRKDHDFQEEFLSYWKPTYTFISNCEANGPSREVTLLLMSRNGAARQEGQIVLSDNTESGRHLIRRLGGAVTQSRTAFFVNLDKPIQPPGFDDVLTVRAAIQIVQGACRQEDWAKLRAWLSQPVLPGLLLLSVPGVDGRILIGMQFDDVPVSARKKAARGFRPEKVHAWRELQYSPDQPVAKVGFDRYDSQFLISRGGATRVFRDKTVAIVGCGAVGSHTAERIASIGVGHLHLVDSELLEAGNLYRHVLGMRDIGAPKADGLRTLLTSRYPGLEVQARFTDVIELMHSEEDFLLKADVLVFALGDETLELRINEMLGRKVPRLHTWVDPLSLGGHVHVTGLAREGGCLRCLFHRLDGVGLTNRASFAEAGQSFQQTIAGCSGVYTPFSALDADRTAIEVARLTGRILSGKEIVDSLVSWFGDPEDFSAKGYRLSKRTHLFQPGECKSAPAADSECPHCAQWRS